MNPLLYLAFLFWIVMPSSSASAAPVAGDLIKASGASVYYYGHDGKRYVFPTEKTYFTWYTDFSGVRMISDDELATIPIGGNVTYRPGVRMLKVTTDPRTYAVDARGTLRWIETESAASAIYGANWAQKIDDLPDPFFVNYKLGSSVTSSASFNPATATLVATSIAVDRGLATPEASTPEPEPSPAPAPTHTGAISASKTIAAANEIVDLYASGSPSASIDLVSIFLNGVSQRECSYTPCLASIVMPASRDVSTAEARFRWITGEVVTSTVSITRNSAEQAGLSLSVTNPEVKPGGTVELIALADSSFIAYTIDIYVDGNDIKGCNSVQECRYVGLESAATGTTHTVYAVFGDRSGTTKSTGVKSWKVVDNPRPKVTVSVGKTLLAAGESTDATVTAGDDDGLVDTQIWWKDGVVKTCLNSICSSVIGPFSEAGTYYVTGRATDAQGVVGEATSSAISVQ